MSDRMRVKVTRGERYDVAEWVPDDGRGGVRRWTPPPDGGSSRWIMLLGAALVIGVVVLIVRSQAKPELGRPLVPTVADVQAVHAGVVVGPVGGPVGGGSEVRRVRRLALGDSIETDADGRARLRLDDGTAFVIDRGTRLVLKAGGVTLERGRLFVLGAPGARSEVDVGGATAIISAANVAVERPAASAATARIYAVNADVTVRAAGKDVPVAAGDTASVNGSEVKVAPERGFDDWTGGMAAPWGAKGPPRRAVGELWGRPQSAPAGDASSPLTLRAHDVRATITGEVAETEVRTTFFNAGSDTVVGDFRMAIPPGAIVSRFASARGDAVQEGHLALAARRQTVAVASSLLLEWAGEGWLRGTLPSIPPGATVSVIVGYVEWLSPQPKGDGKSAVVQYRYPMASDAAPPLVGEFSARVDATPSQPISIAAGLGARVDGQAVEVRRPDFRPTADLVVDVEIPAWTAPARLYLSPPGEDEAAGPTVLVRTETPAATKEDGVTLAIVVDVSSSVEPSLLEAERAVVDAVLAGLGARDRAIVLAADQTVRPVGPAAIGPVDDARRKAVTAALAEIGPGGATDLGRALEAGADALPPDAPAAMVIYVGDGWPTVGDPGADAILARLARRPGGAPRIGAVGVGPLVNRFALASLVRGSGPLLEVADSSDAARVAVELISEALQPTVAGVEVKLGPEVERVYPRGARALVAGETAYAVGRLRGEVPREITLAWRDAKGAHEEKRAVTVLRSPSEPDVSRRWAAARVEEIALRGKGRETATDVALRAGLLTPWTGWLVGDSSPTYVPTAFPVRVLDLASGADVGFSAELATPRTTFGTLSDAIPSPYGKEDDDDGLKAAIAAAAQRVIDEAGPAVRACRDSRAALRPELAGALDVALSVDGDGRPGGVKVRFIGGADDEPLDRCVKVVIEGLTFPASDLAVTVDVRRSIPLPPPRATLRGRKCSPTSLLPMPLRRGVWKQRLDRMAAATVYLEAKQSCELPIWTDRRALLELVLLQAEAPRARLDTARDLDRAGEADAAGLLRRETVRRARTPEELRAIKLILLGEERYPAGVFRKRLRAAGDDKERLAVVRKFLAIAPHDGVLRRRLVALLEALGRTQEVAEEVRRVRLDPFADATLLAEGASALRRIGAEAEARRAFGELAERAPRDPWARAFLGDRLRAEGWFDDATAAYAVLAELVPDEPAAALRVALAHAGGGRLDIAQRTLARVAQTGGRAGDATLSELAGHLAGVLVAEARTRPGTSKEDAERLGRAALELPRPAGATLLLVRAPASASPIVATLVRGPREAREERQPDVSAPGLGLAAMRLEAGDASEIVLRLRGGEELPPTRPTRVHVDALVPDGAGKPPRVVSTDIDVPPTGKAVELRWANGAFSAG